MQKKNIYNNTNPSTFAEFSHSKNAASLSAWRRIFYFFFSLGFSETLGKSKPLAVSARALMVSRLSPSKTFDGLWRSDRPFSRKLIPSVSEAACKTEG